MVWESKLITHKNWAGDGRYTLYCVFANHSPNGVRTIFLCVRMRVCIWDSKKEGDRKQGKRGRMSKKGVVNPVTHTANTQTSPQTMALVLSYYRQPWLNHTAPQATHETAAPHYSYRGKGRLVGGLKRRSDSMTESRTDVGLKWIYESRQQTKYQKLFLQ